MRLGETYAEKRPYRKWPKDRIPKGALQNLKDADGKFANQSLFQGEPIVQKKLINAVDSISGRFPKAIGSSI